VGRVFVCALTFVVSMGVQYFVCSEANSFRCCSTGEDVMLLNMETIAVRDAETPLSALRELVRKEEICPAMRAAHVKVFFGDAAVRGVWGVDCCRRWYT
jgi:hypothetical protein